MPGRRALSRIQIGRETTPGTMVAATARMRWDGGFLHDDRTVEFLDEAVGIFRVDRSVITAINAAIDINETSATPEQLPYLLAMALGGPTTGVADGTASSGYRYATTIPTTTPPNNVAYTIEAGDDYEVERAGYLKITELTLRGAGAQSITMTARGIAQRVERLAAGFSTTSLVDVDDLVFGLSRCYLDPASGSFGTTQITNQFKGFEITISSMWERQYTGEASTSVGPIWTYVVFAGYEIRGKLTLTHDPAVSGSGGLRQWLREQSPRLLRIDCLGRAYTTTGTGTLLGGRRGIRIDLPIKVTAIPAMGDDNRVSVVTVEFESRYNATAGTAGTITVCNETSTLP